MGVLFDITIIVIIISSSISIVVMVSFVSRSFAMILLLFVENLVHSLTYLYTGRYDSSAGDASFVREKN